jgi:hypothetical protein
VVLDQRWGSPERDVERFLLLHRCRQIAYIYLMAVPEVLNGRFNTGETGRRMRAHNWTR